MKNEKIVLVAGTFDILHESHVNMLRNAKNLGNQLIVMLSTDEFNIEKGKKSFQDYDTRKYVLESIRYVDLVVPEQSWDDKGFYIDMFGVNIFAMGDDWRGKFDFLKEEFPDLKIMYFPRGKVSSSNLKQELGKLYLSHDKKISDLKDE
ncbi:MULTISPECIES: glycerol-3-phosphate cytidylyltransferase [Lactococcus]|jgi:glycerol-3-phosphate cytidylyltransferase|uniref:Glycerol-3-phosphate cytidylyltransferase n=1 Tax=Lactococcus lactis TaxID=1358 RepID=A0A6B3S7K7_9LACT|nr:MULTISPECIES: glycerol-3-phosphate cytidylyltransferase [Lactococcus]MCA2380407.1 glycerol-3-phosphate cytidylyltransferase [Lactococcus sp. SK2-659]MCI2095458.1 glycerol-3-phosphate cytidylyltransferase [Lactococcus lactis]MCI2138753.1 glycerol-3-phosphate cytidylyltransferase [Lactococcus lactis]MCT1173377.1 glycerol-3-phosphate cytidylyltransferase [Lactococcus lactis]MCT1184811.1 glycerol-3-phosphate cytidylyltransferase [Lactococcus lactis]